MSEKLEQGWYWVCQQDVESIQRMQEAGVREVGDPAWEAAYWSHQYGGKWLVAGLDLNHHVRFKTIGPRLTPPTPKENWEMEG